MSTSRATEALRPILPSRGTVIVVLLTVVVATSEMLLLRGMFASAIYAYLGLLIVLSLVPLLLEQETPLFQAFVLVPVFRLVDLTMPVFIELTLFWFPLVYGPLIPVFVYIGRRTVNESGPLGAIRQATVGNGPPRDEDDPAEDGGSLAALFDPITDRVSAVAEATRTGGVTGDRFDRRDSGTDGTDMSNERSASDDDPDAPRDESRDTEQRPDPESVPEAPTIAFRRMQEGIRPVDKDEIEDFSVEGIEDYLTVDELITSDAADTTSPQPRPVTFDDAVPVVRSVETGPTPADPGFDDASPAVRPTATARAPGDDGLDSAEPVVNPVAGEGSLDAQRSQNTDRSNDTGPSDSVARAIGALRAFMIWLWTPQRNTLHTAGIGFGLPWWLGGRGGGKIRWLLRRGWQFLVPDQDRRTWAWLAFHLLTRGIVVALIPIAVAVLLLSVFLTSVYLAEIEYDIITPAPLVASLDPYQLIALTIVMICFVGFVEELLFRGILQQVLEAQLGPVPGLLLASGLFGLMHSVYGLPIEILFAGVIGFIFGIVYDVTDSLVLVSVMHGLVNVFLFGIIPLDGASSLDLLRAVAVQGLERIGADWAVDLLPPLANQVAGVIL